MGSLSRTVGQHLDHRVYSTAISVVGARVSDQGARESGRSLEAANAFVQNDRVGPQDVRLKVNGGFATLVNDLLQPSVHVLSPVLVLKARAVPEMSVYILVELIGAHLTEAEHAEVVELEGPGAISPELLAVHLVILARELRVGPSNIVEADLQAHRRFCNTPFVTSAGNRPRSRLFGAALSG